MNYTIYMTLLMCTFVFGMSVGILFVMLVIKRKGNTVNTKVKYAASDKFEKVKQAHITEENINVNSSDASNKEKNNLLTSRINETKSLNQVLSEAANEDFSQTLRNQLSEVDEDFEYLANKN